jgi:hypothetical protein
MLASPSPRDSLGYIPWWLLAIVAVLFFMAAIVLVGVVTLTRTADLPQPTATVMLVTAPASSIVTTATIQSPPTTEATEPTGTPPPPPPGQVTVGSYVQVTGTGDDGFLNLRAEPSLKSPVQYLALEREVFQVQAGPTEANGFVWWYLIDPATNTRSGWGVQNYLQVVQGQ